MNYKVVIVNYGKSRAAAKLIGQLLAQSAPPSSISVIDNTPDLNKDDYSGLGESEINIEHLPENVGYSRGCNRGASGEWDYVAFINPDIEIEDVSLFSRLLLRLSGIPDVGCAGVSQMNPDGSFEIVARRSPSISAIVAKRISFFNRLFATQVRTYLNSYDCSHSATRECFAVDWLQSSFLVVPKNVWQRYGGFDERFFVFMADVEYGRRMHENGLKSYLLPEFVIAADGVRASGGGLLSVVRSVSVRIHIRDALRYFLFRDNG